MSDITIIGAGMAGLLAARMLKQRGHNPTILETQPSLPNNHNAVLRFRSNLIGDITGIQFKKVQMIKSSVIYLNPVAEALAYSRKAMGLYQTDRSINVGLLIAERYIAPPDFIAKLAEGLNIQFTSYQMQAFDMRTNPDIVKLPIISTMPMPSLIKLLAYQGGSMDHLFKSTDSHVLKAKIMKCDAYATLYVANPDLPFYRISITGDELIIELVGYPEDKFLPVTTQAKLGIIDRALELLGIKSYDLNVTHVPEIKKQRYAKILPVDEKLRKGFMAWATDKHNVYSLGRFATWRPGLLLDDLVQDIKLIEKWITSGSNYEMRRTSR